MIPPLPWATYSSAWLLFLNKTSFRWSYMSTAAHRMFGIYWICIMWEKIWCIGDYISGESTFCRGPRNKAFVPLLLYFCLSQRERSVWKSNAELSSFRSLQMWCIHSSGNPWRVAVNVFFTSMGLTSVAILAFCQQLRQGWILLQIFQKCLWITLMCSWNVLSNNICLKSMCYLLHI